MNNHRRHSEASERFAERRRREDEATRLSAELPRLLTLRLEVQERNEVESLASNLRTSVASSSRARPHSSSSRAATRVAKTAATTSRDP